MSEQLDRAVIASLQKMVVYCKEMQALLNQDKDCFSRNDLSTVETSNKKKAVLIQHLNETACSIANGRPAEDAEGFLSKMEVMAEQSKSTTQYELQAQINQLKSEIASCYQSIAVNSRIVFSNIKQLKLVIDRLASSRSAECVYDNTGNTIEYYEDR